MKLVDIDTKVTVLLWDDEHEEEVEREMTVGEMIDEFTVESLLEVPLYRSGRFEKQGVPSDFPPQFEADKLNTNYYAIVAIVMRGGPEELADFLEHAYLLPAHVGGHSFHLNAVFASQSRQNLILG